MSKITYHKEGDYLIPDLIIEENKANKDYHIGKYGNLRLNYIKQHKRGFYTELQMSGKLREHLIDVDKQANKEVAELIKEFAEIENIPIYFDGRDPLEWVGHMNNIKNRAEEIVFSELIYV